MEDMRQQQFPWGAPGASRDAHEVVLDRETTEMAIMLMARALIAVVRAVEETDDER